MSGQPSQSSEPSAGGGQPPGGPGRWFSTLIGSLAPASPTSPALPDQARPDPEGTRALSRPAALTDEPLLSNAAGLRARWQQVQADFVDDPQEAVGDAADLIEQTAQALIAALRQRQRQLRIMWVRGPAPAPEDEESATRAADTEHLRLVMQRYRALFNQLCQP